MRPKRKVERGVCCVIYGMGFLGCCKRVGVGARCIDHVVHVSSLNVTNTLLVPALLLLPLQYTHGQ